MRRRAILGALGLALTAGLALPSAAFATTPRAVHAISKRAFIKAADDLCRQNDIILDDLAGEHFADLAEGQEPTEEEFAAFIEEAEPTLRQLVDSLRALPKPKGDKKRLKKIFNLVEDGVDNLVDDPGAYIGANPFVKADKAGKKYGFKVCGSN